MLEPVQLQAMFVGISTRKKTVLRWATPLLLLAVWLVYVLGAMGEKKEEKPAAHYLLKTNEESRWMGTAQKSSVRAA